MTLTMNDLDQPSIGMRHLPMLAIALAHVALIYALLHGAAAKVVQIFPKEVFVSLIQAVEPPAKTLAPQLALSKPLTPPPSPIAPPPEVLTSQIRQIAENTINAAPAQAMPSKSAYEPSIASATPAPMAAAASAQPKLVSGVEYLQAPQADYPALARRMGEEGKVSLLVLVNEKGRAEKVEIQKSSGSHRLDEAARLALMRALFKPHIEDGKALMMLATATISFSLNG